ncbi:TPA: hypothetical protein PMB17_002557 [Vibrio cholerae]|nr:hypothetical protein [Vibrio cholerae]
MSGNNSYKEDKKAFDDYVAQQTKDIQEKYTSLAKVKIQEMKDAAFKSVNPNKTLSLGYGESYHYSCEEKTDLSVIGNMVKGIVSVFTGSNNSINMDGTKAEANKDNKDKTDKLLENLTGQTSILAKSQATYLLLAGEVIGDILNSLTYEESNTYSYEVKTESVGIGLRMFCYAVSAKRDTNHILVSSSVYNYYFTYELCFNLDLAKQDAQVEHVLELESQIESFNMTINKMIQSLGSQLASVPLDNIDLSKALSARLDTLKMLQDQQRSAYEELQNMKNACKNCDLSAV